MTTATGSRTGGRVLRALVILVVAFDVFVFLGFIVDIFNGTGLGRQFAILWVQSLVAPLAGAALPAAILARRRRHLGWALALALSVIPSALVIALIVD